MLDRSEATLSELRMERDGKNKFFGCGVTFYTDTFRFYAFGGWNRPKSTFYSLQPSIYLLPLQSYGLLLEKYQLYPIVPIYIPLERARRVHSE